MASCTKNHKRVRNNLDHKHVDLKLLAMSYAHASFGASSSALNKPAQRVFKLHPVAIIPQLDSPKHIPDIDIAYNIVCKLQSCSPLGQLAMSLLQREARLWQLQEKHRRTHLHDGTGSTELGSEVIVKRDWSRLQSSLFFEMFCLLHLIWNYRSTSHRTT